jgi:hypothetical protein
MTFSSTQSGRGTSEIRRRPAAGKRMPMPVAAQTRDPKVRMAKRTWRSSGIRPNSRTDAQPRVVVSTLPVNRPSMPRRAVMIAIAGCSHRSLSGRR